MERSQLTESSAYKVVGIAAIAVLTSALTAIGVLFMLRWRRSKRPYGGDRVEVERIPTQPAVDTSMSVQAPQHFTEEMVVPGRTYTGAEIVQQDEEAGRSAEGA